MTVHAQATVQFLANRRLVAIVPTTGIFQYLKIEEFEPQ